MTTASVPVKLSLDPYEKTLLDEFTKLYKIQTDDVTEESLTGIQDVFSKWLWRRKVYDNFHDLTHLKRLVEDMSGNVEVIWSTYLHFLHYYRYNFLYFRTDKLKLDNPDIIERIKEVGVEQPLDLATKLAENDLCYWALITKLSGDNEMGVINWEDMTLTELMLSMRPPLRTVEEQQLSVSSEEWETTDESEASDPEHTIGVEASAARSDHESGACEKAGVNGGEQEQYRSEEEPAEDSRLKEIAVQQQDTDQEPGVSDSSDEDSSEAANDDDDIYVPFEVYALLRKVSILQRRQRNADLAFECINDGEFGKYYAKVTEGVFVRDPRAETLRSGLSAMTTHIGLVNHLGIWGDQGFLVTDDPRTFVEYIPSSELHNVNGSGNAENDCVLWSPEKPVPTMEHHLVTEECVFRYCVLNDFHFPGHLEGDRIAFVKTPLLETNFVPELQLFWQKWSDCAVTREPDSGDWILLETRPGRKFRDIWAKDDHLTALKYFRNIVDHERFANRPQVEDYIGSAFQPQYKNLLQAIPFEELEILEGDPLKGSRGVVYKATHRCPQKIEMPEAKVQTVALKSLQGLSEEDKEGLMKELEITFEALKGSSIQMVKFLGITRSPADLQGSKLPRDTLFLVSEFALEGDGQELVKRVLKGTPRDWDMMLRFISDIASGLNAIHSRGVLHRDLHWGNILGTTKRFDRQLLPQIRDGQIRDDEENVELVIADLGEGKIVGKMSALGRQYGNAEFRAPEVVKYGPRAYTAASDMYAMGRLAEDIVEEYWKASEKTGDHRRLISQTLRDLVRRLKSEDPALRPSAKEVSDAILDVWRKGRAGEWDFDPSKIDLVPYEEPKIETRNEVQDEIP